LIGLAGKKGKGLSRPDSLDKSRVAFTKRGMNEGKEVLYYREALVTEKKILDETNFRCKLL